MSNDVRQPIKLCQVVTCPHCWHSFAPEEALWIAEHPDLSGDLRLGADQAQRFLPMRFNAAGAALDARGVACRGLACPNCHLPTPHSLFESPPIFLSIMGGPASGKSYLLAAMTWRLRSVLPRSFHLAFGDADPAANLRLHDYESLQFCNPDQDTLAAIEKTETHGDLYDTVLFGDRNVSFPRPFLFSLSPMESHPNYAAMRRVSRVLCLYDNAGESFLPGQDTNTEPVTRHLVQSHTLLFLFDPTQDLRFQRACMGRTNDPQMLRQRTRLERERPVRQEIILTEVAQRIRRLSGLSQHDRYQRPLIIVVTKYDCWSSLLHDKQLDDPWVTSRRTSMCAVDLQEIDATSERLRALLWQLTPELVSTAEQFAKTVVYIPVSATGRAPEVDASTGAFGFRPRDIAPVWAEAPVLYSLARWMNNVLPYYRPKSQQAGGTSPAAAAREARHGGGGSAPESRPAESPRAEQRSRVEENPSVEERSYADERPYVEEPPRAEQARVGQPVAKEEAEEEFDADGEFPMPPVAARSAQAVDAIEPDEPIAPPTSLRSRPENGEATQPPPANPNLWPPGAQLP